MVARSVRSSSSSRHGSRRPLALESNLIKATSRHSIVAVKDDKKNTPISASTWSDPTRAVLHSPAARSLRSPLDRFYGHVMWACCAAPVLVNGCSRAPRPHPSPRAHLPNFDIGVCSGGRQEKISSEGLPATLVKWAMACSQGRSDELQQLLRAQWKRC